MRWFLTGDSLGIAEELHTAGETVISQPNQYRSAQPDIEESMDYKLSVMLRHQQLDVLLLDDVFVEPGYAKRHIVPWGGAVRGRCVVGISAGDPDAYAKARNAWRGCVCRMSQLGVYVTPDADSANMAARTGRRVVFWQEDISPLIRAVSDTCNYRQLPDGNGRIYIVGGNVASL